MAERVPDAASYAPVTILVSERQDGVHLSYDSMSTYLAPYGDAQALEVAKDLDEKVVTLLERLPANDPEPEFKAQGADRRFDRVLDHQRTTDT